MRCSKPPPGSAVGADLKDIILIERLLLRGATPVPSHPRFAASQDPDDHSGVLAKPRGCQVVNLALQWLQRADHPCGSFEFNRVSRSAQSASNSRRRASTTGRMRWTRDMNQWTAAKKAAKNPS